MRHRLPVARVFSERSARDHVSNIKNASWTKLTFEERIGGYTIHTFNAI